MSNDSRFVLAKLTRSGIWSTRDNLLKYKRIILDVDSITTYLYQYCTSKHIKRCKSLNPSSIDYHSATIVNYTEYSSYVKQLLDFLIAHSIEIFLVYRGKYMEAPMFGLLPAQFKKNTQRVCEQLLLTINYEKNKSEPQLGSIRPPRPNLALNVFKMLVAAYQSGKNKIQAHQAFYSPYPTLAKLARDLKAPILTNDGDFIIMDVRAGFILFDEFWRTYVEIKDAISKHQSTSSQASLATAQCQKSSSKSAVSPIRSSKSLFNMTKTSEPSVKRSKIMIKFHHHLKFLRQHPGLTAPLSLHMFPLTSGEFLTTHPKSLLKLKIFEDTYGEKDFLNIHDTKQERFKRYHQAAARLEQVITFMGNKNPETLGNLIRGEAVRTNSTFEEDFRELFNYYAVSYDFKNRLKLILRRINDSMTLNHIERCLLSRENSADYLLSLLCCSIGHLASVSYNKSLLFEDLNSKHSACSMLDRGKGLLMSLFSDNKSHKNEHSTKLSSKQQDQISSRYSLASLTVIDREGIKLTERELTTTHENKEVDSIRSRITLGDLARRRNPLQASIRIMCIAFKTGDMTKLSPKLDAYLSKLLPSKKSGQHQPSWVGLELAVMLNLHRYSVQTASVGDDYFSRTYKNLTYHFEIGLLNHHVYIECSTTRINPPKELKQMIDLVLRNDYENTASNRPPKSSAPPSNKSSSSGRSRFPGASPPSDEGVAKNLSKHIRHLLELLNSSIEAYCELNAFLNYPSLRLNLHQHYNPILLYNLTRYSFTNPDDNTLIPMV